MYSCIGLYFSVKLDRIIVFVKSHVTELLPKEERTFQENGIKILLVHFSTVVFVLSL